MASIYDLYGTDKKMEAEGFEFVLRPETKDPVTGEVIPAVVFTLARAGGANSAYQKALEKKTRPHRRALKNDDMDTELMMSFLREAFAETVILDWKGVIGPDGTALNHSRAAAVSLLKDLPDLFDELREAATSASNFRAEELKEDSGN